MLGGMTMSLRRLMLTFGLVLLVGGLVAATYGKLELSSGHPTGSSTLHTGTPMDRTLLIRGVVSLAIGAGLIGLGCCGLRITRTNGPGVGVSDNASRVIHAVRRRNGEWWKTECAGSL